MKRILLDPAKVFGVGTTGDFRSLAATFRRPELESPSPDWHKLFRISGGKNVQCLPQQCPKVGTIILVFQAEGRIDRYKVLGHDQVICYYSAKGKLTYSYESSWESVRVGEIGEWYYSSNGGDCSINNSPICRIVLIGS